ncbi:hypothetical protein ASF03_02240 [Rhizobium sp. Leaf68]|nr:hypothetical protein ASE62_02085 [Rhizobium sp. Leaf202]KQN87822.1 hypothetical protein ASF03_02240 [Rhizobium sp. Leaf68]
MTPSEHARLIDQQEFATECLAVRQRAYALVADRRARMREAINAFLGRPLWYVAPPKPITPPRRRPPALIEPKPQPNRKRKRTRAAPLNRRKSGPKAKLYTVDGVTMTRAEWAEQLGMTKGTLALKVHRLGSLEAVIARAKAEHRFNASVLSRMVAGFRRVRNYQIIDRISSMFVTAHSCGSVMRSEENGL